MTSRPRIRKYKGYFIFFTIFTNAIAQLNFSDTIAHVSHSPSSLALMMHRQSWDLPVNDEFAMHFYSARSMIDGVASDKFLFRILRSTFKHTILMIIYTCFALVYAKID